MSHPAPADAVVLVAEANDPKRLYFFCPGCKQLHVVSAAVWTWNGDLVKPTFTPSIKVTGTNMTEKGQADFDAWAEAGYPEPAPLGFESKPTCCHSYITDGIIDYCSDSTHSLAGQKAPLPADPLNAPR